MRTVVLAPSAWSWDRAPSRAPGGPGSMLPSGRRWPPRGWLHRDARRIYLELKSHGAGDVINLVPLVQELAARHPTAILSVVTNHDRIPFAACAPNVRTLASLPADEHIDGVAACHLDLEPWVRYHSLCPHWLQYLVIAGVGGCTLHDDPFPLLGDGSSAASTDAPHVLLHARNRRVEWQGRNSAEANLRRVVARLRQRGYRVLAVGNDAAPDDDIEHLGQLTVAELARAMRRANGFVGIDSFPMHLAALYDKPILGFFGATYPSVVLTPVTRLVTLRNPAISCHGCVYVTRPAGYNQCHFGDERCGEVLPEPHADGQTDAFLALLGDGNARIEMPSDEQLAYQLRLGQQAFEQTLVIESERAWPHRRLGERLLTPDRLRPLVRWLTSWREDKPA